MLDIKGDPINDVVEILLSPNQKGDADRLEKQKKELDQ